MTTATTAYISTGDLTAMYTLRICTMGTHYHNDSYIKNLSTDESKANRLLEEYCEKTGFSNGGNAIGELNPKAIGGKWELINQNAVANGVMPWGKHRGDQINSIDVDYLNYMYGVLEGETVEHKVMLRALIGRLYGVQFKAIADKQEADKLARKALERPVPVTDKRIQIKGRIVSCKEQDSIYGTTYKMLVLSEVGFKVWGSIPKGLDGSLEELKGRDIEFMAKVEPSKNDANFGFFNRPTKAIFVA